MRRYNGQLSAHLSQNTPYKSAAADVIINIKAFIISTLITSVSGCARSSSSAAWNAFQFQVVTLDMLSFCLLQSCAAGRKLLDDAGHFPSFIPSCVVCVCVFSSTANLPSATKMAWRLT